MDIQDNPLSNPRKVHITNYRDHVSTYIALVLLTIMTFSISAYGADLYALSVLTVLLIASTKATVVGWYFMHLKYESRLFLLMIAGVVILFITFAALTLVDYAVRT